MTLKTGLIILAILILVFLVVGRMGDDTTPEEVEPVETEEPVE